GVSRPSSSTRSLRRRIAGAGLGKRIADKLVKVVLLDGSETRILGHVEGQGYVDAQFEERVYVCNHRIFDATRHETVSIVVLTDSGATYRPCRFERRRWRQTQLLEFPVVKLLDYRARWGCSRWIESL